MKTELLNEEMEYVQSANSLFHFMEKGKFLTDVLERKGLVPRYCVENIGYLDLNVNQKKIDKILVLQKCFCDIRFHKFAEQFLINIIDEDRDDLSEDEKKQLYDHNTHPDYYGKFAIAFSKNWCIKRNFQPVQYINPESNLSEQFKNAFECAIEQSELSEIIVDDTINRLVYFKPLYGEMIREVQSGKLVRVYKNFHDEHEWRYIPTAENLILANKGKVIVKSYIQERKNNINKEMEDSSYEYLWIKFDYDDISYLIVPNSASRIELIEFIMQLSSDKFKMDIPTEIQKYILISKILTLEEIRKDW